MDWTVGDVIEEWRPIQGYCGLYAVSNLGRILSNARLVSGANGRKYMTKPRIMKPGAGKSKYLTVRLTNSHGVAATHYVHTLVLGEFSGPRPDGMEACHCDGNRQNNADSNLRWDTRSGNHADKKWHGTATAGERHPGAKVTDSIVKRMRERRSEGASATDLSIEFGLSRAAALRAATGKAWTHLNEK